MGKDYPKKTLRHGDSCIVIFGCETKNSANCSNFNGIFIIDLIIAVFAFKYYYIVFLFQTSSFGWSGGAMVLGRLPVPGRPTKLKFWIK